MTNDTKTQEPNKPISLWLANVLANTTHKGRPALDALKDVRIKDPSSDEVLPLRRNSTGWLVPDKNPTSSAEVAKVCMDDKPLFESMADVIHYRAVGDLGYYCATHKGFRKAQRLYTQGLDDAMFHKNRKLRCPNEPSRFPCVVKFTLDASGSIYVQYVIDRDTASTLRELCKSRK